MIIKFKDLLPNPNRDLQLNPYNESKIQELMDSIEETGFWENVVVRKNAASKYEMAYGHHRVKAAERKGLTEADFIVKELDDDMMRKMMRRENMETARYCILSLLEAVKAEVKAISKEIPLDMRQARSDTVRDAPSFIPGVSGLNLSPHPYTAMNVAERLGETRQKKERIGVNVKVLTALDALYLLEIQDITVKAIRDLNVAQLQKVVSDRKKAIEVKQQARERAASTEKELREKQLALDAKRKAEEAEEARRLEEFRRREREAKVEEDAKEIARIAADRKEQGERQAAREKQWKEKRGILDTKIAEASDRAQAEVKAQNKGLQTRHEVKNVLFKLTTITSERFAFRQEIKDLAKDKEVTQGERELLRQAMLNAGNWYTKSSDVFLPPKTPAQEVEELRTKDKTREKRK